MEFSSGVFMLPQVAFAGPDSDKLTYKVIPLGPVNGSQMFTTFIHGIDPTWTVLAKSKGVSIGVNTNARITVDKILSWASKLKTALLYMECQLRVYCLKTCS